MRRPWFCGSLSSYLVAVVKLLCCCALMVITEFKPLSGGFDYANPQLDPDVTGVQHHSSTSNSRFLVNR